MHKLDKLAVSANAEVFFVYFFASLVFMQSLFFFQILKVEYEWAYHAVFQIILGLLASHENFPSRSLILGSLFWTLTQIQKFLLMLPLILPQESPITCSG